MELLMIRDAMSPQETRPYFAVIFLWDTATPIIINDVTKSNDIRRGHDLIPDDLCFPFATLIKSPVIFGHELECHSWWLVWRSIGYVWSISFKYVNVKRNTFPSDSHFKTLLTFLSLNTHICIYDLFHHWVTRFMLFNTMYSLKWMSILFWRPHY